MKERRGPGDDRVISLRGITLAILLATPVAGAAFAGTEEAKALREQLSAASAREDRPAIVELGRRIVENAPEDADTWEKMVRAQLALKEYERAGVTLERWAEKARIRPAAIDDLRGDLAAAQKDDAAAARFWGAFTNSPGLPEARAATLTKMADACAEQKRWAENAELRSQAAGLRETAASRVAHAVALLHLHKWEAAYAEMKHADALDAADGTVEEWQPPFELLAGSLPKIKALDTQLARAPNDTGILLERARVFTRAGRAGRALALDDCERAFALQPQSMRARIQLAEALQDSGKAPEAATRLQVSRELARGDDKHVSDAALRALGGGDATMVASAADVNALCARAQILRELKQFVLAEKEARAALALDENAAAPHFELAHALDALGEKGEALEEVRAATKLKGDDPGFWYYRGVLEAQRTDFAAAIASETRSLELRESLVALREREHSYRRIGKIAEADADRQRSGAIEGKQP